MEMDKLGHFFKRALLVEDSEDICDFYKDFFEMEELPLDILMAIPKDVTAIAETYDVLICDWFVGPSVCRKMVKEIGISKTITRSYYRRDWDA